MYIYSIVEWYSASLTFITVGFLEAIAVCYIYGIDRFCSDIELMLHYKPSRVIRFLWLFVTPLILGVINNIFFSTFTLLFSHRLS